jgi:hypothetical protein
VIPVCLYQNHLRVFIQIQRNTQSGDIYHVYVLWVDHSLPRSEGRRTPMPTFVATVPPTLQPNQPRITFLANISPNPNMTPFTNGSNKFMPRDEKNADKRARVGSDWSNMARVADRGALAGAGGGWCADAPSLRL